jgi:predicted outer membrane repeat protein
MKLEEMTMSKVTKRMIYRMISIIIPAMLCGAAAGKIIYVDDDAAGSNDGSSWVNAYVCLQDALAEANSAEKPVEIRVAQGIYVPDQGAYQIPGEREATFQLISGVTLKGGYAGLSEPDPNARDFELFETILSGDLNDDDVQVDVVEVADLKDLESEPTRMENSYHVVTSSGADDSAILDGFIITAGYANDRERSGGDRWSFRTGAGLYNVSGSPIVANCTFTKNSAYYGGGMDNTLGNPTIVSCTFNRNSGGGMKNELSTVTLSDCIFTSNSICGMANWDSSLILTNCTFSENWASSGGGIGSTFRSTLKLIDCTFIRNSADVSGGGIDGGSGTLTNCAFIANESNHCGGGICSGSFSLTNCTFIANKAGNWGGGMYHDTVSSVTNCLFSGNSAKIGGGIYNYSLGTKLILTNCTLTGNSARYGNAFASHNMYGGLFYGDLKLTNCIIWGSGNEIWNDVGSAIVISYSDIHGGQAGIYDPYGVVIWGKGNIDADPLFADMGHWVDVNDPNVIVEPDDPNNALWVNGDYHLKSEAGRWDPNNESWVIDDVTSPCIDAGDPLTPVMYEPHPRGCFINMGAYGGTKEASKSPFNCPYKLDGER